MTLSHSSLPLPEVDHIRTVAINQWSLVSWARLRKNFECAIHQMRHDQRQDGGLPQVCPLRIPKGQRMKYEIKHLELGGVLDQAIKVTKDNFGELLKVMLFLYIPANLVIGLVVLSLTPAPPGIGATDAQQAEYLQEVMKHAPLLIGIGLISGLVILPLTNAAVVNSVANLYLGQKVSAGESISKAFGKLLSLLGVSIMTGLAVFVGMFLCVIPGIIFAFWFALATHVVVIEGVGGTAAMGRSKQLVSGNMGTLFVLGLILFVIGAGIGMTVAFVPNPHVQLLLRLFVQSAATILGTAVMVVFYFSCRCGHENFDLQHLASAMGQEGDFPSNPSDDGFGDDPGGEDRNPFAE